MLVKILVSTYRQSVVYCGGLCCKMITFVVGLGPLGDVCVWTWDVHGDIIPVSFKYLRSYYFYDWTFLKIENQSMGGMDVAKVIFCCFLVKGGITWDVIQQFRLPVAVVYPPYNSLGTNVTLASPQRLFLGCFFNARQYEDSDFGEGLGLWELLPKSSITRLYLHCLKLSSWPVGLSWTNTYYSDFNNAQC